MENTRDMLDRAVALLEEMESIIFAGASFEGLAERYDSFMEDFND